MATEPKTEKEITVEEKLKALYELQKVDSKRKRFPNSARRIQTIS